MKKVMIHDTKMRKLSAGKDQYSTEIGGKDWHTAYNKGCGKKQASRNNDMC
jgi:hypothetical protein